MIHIRVKEFKQVIYEYKPKFCNQCQQFGHVCPKPKKVMQWVPKKVPSTPSPNHVPTMVTPNAPIGNMNADNKLGWQATTKIARHSQSPSRVITRYATR